ncbi:MAG TPA: hypothetical protein ENK16_07920 [Chromatiales bacterium]|nr:hypothetical protein [Chromatiales bacterium]
MASPATNAKPAAGTGDPFELSSVDQIEPPVDGDKGKWCKYTITQGANVITGYRKGSRTAVTKAAKVIVADLNERRFGRRGRVHLTNNSSRQASR